MYISSFFLLCFILTLIKIATICRYKCNYRKKLRRDIAIGLAIPSNTEEGQHDDEYVYMTPRMDAPGTPYATTGGLLTN